MIATVGCVPQRFGHAGGHVALDLVFDMARGRDDAVAMEMTKWFDTNYHYIVPELHSGQTFALSSRKAIDEFVEALALGIRTRPVLLGPVSFLSLGKAVEPGFDPLDLLDRLLPVYAELLAGLAEAGADWVQIDEPVLVLDLSEAQRQAFVTAYETLAANGPKIMLATYFGGLGANLETAVSLPVGGLHVDLVRAPDQLDAVLDAIPGGRILSIGVVDGRNVWRTDLTAALAPVCKAVARLGDDQVQVASSCSLLHSPVDLEAEDRLDAELLSWLAFAKQKLAEIAALADAMRAGRTDGDAFRASDVARATRAASPRTHDPKVADRLREAESADLSRQAPFAERRAAQYAKWPLPPFPTTTIGSFPQTVEVRRARAAHRRGEMSAADYDAFLKAETERTIREQEAAGLDVLVHGEFERNDMVEYFGEQLDGFAFTRFGWVQSYGSRCVKPPIVFGDVSRPHPMTVEWSTFAKSRTVYPMKGMLTGPRDDSAVVLRARRPAAQHDLQADCPGRARRGARSGSRGDRHHPDRRTGIARRAVVAPRRLGGVSGLGGDLLPHGLLGGGGRDADPHPHVLQRVP